MAIYRSKLSKFAERLWMPNDATKRFGGYSLHHGAAAVVTI